MARPDCYRHSVSAGHLCLIDKKQRPAIQLRGVVFFMRAGFLARLLLISYNIVQIQQWQTIVVTGAET